MNNSNNYNICPRCGTANSLSSKFCFQCGAALKVPEEPIVCPTCKRINSSLANFCLSCGTPLKVGGETKICPRCGKEVVADQTVCNCGYRFGPIRQVNPSREPTDPRTGAGYPAAATTAVEEPKASSPRSAGRVMALIALLLGVAILYALFSNARETSNMLFFIPQLTFLDAFNPIFYSAGGQLYSLSFADYIYVNLLHLNSLTIGNYVLLAFIGIALVAIASYILVAIVRLFTGKRSRSANIALLVLAFLSTLLAALSMVDRFLSVELLSAALRWLVFADMFTVAGFGFVVLAGAFWVLFLYSVICKCKQPKKEEITDLV
jgi:hypothetical protein